MFSFKHVVKLTAISLIVGMPSFAGLIQDPGATGVIVMGVAPYGGAPNVGGPTYMANNFTGPHKTDEHFKRLLKPKENKLGSTSQRSPPPNESQAITLAPLTGRVSRKVWLPESDITRNRNWHARPESLYVADFKTTSVKSAR
jgi:hypothetical protein